MPRRVWDADAGANLSADANMFLGVLGVGGCIAFVGMLMFILLTVAAVFFGKKNDGHAMTAW